MRKERLPGFFFAVAWLDAQTYDKKKLKKDHLCLKFDISRQERMRELY